MEGKIICFNEEVYDDFDNIPSTDREKLKSWFVLNKHELADYYVELDFEQFQNEFNNGLIDYDLILIL